MPRYGTITAGAVCCSIHAIVSSLPSLFNLSKVGLHHPTFHVLLLGKLQRFFLTNPTLFRLALHLQDYTIAQHGT